MVFTLNLSKIRLTSTVIIANLCFAKFIINFF